MTDLVILVPSRGRPASVARLAEACAKTCRTGYLLHFGLDEDDPAAEDAVRAAREYEPLFNIGPRVGLTSWTNLLAADHPDVPYLASLGDDHLPVTTGWDEQLITAVEHMGGGIAYPNDERRVDIPEAAVISTPIVKALGWMACPTMNHWYIDNVWNDLGRGAGCLAFCRDVLVKHLHPNVAPGTPVDATYTDAAGDWDADLRAYQKWRLYQMRADIATVRTCLSPPS